VNTRGERRREAVAAGGEGIAVVLIDRRVAQRILAAIATLIRSGGCSTTQSSPPRR
jgi:hypothetical protein